MCLYFNEMKAFSDFIPPTPERRKFHHIHNPEKYCVRNIFFVGRKYDLPLATEFHIYFDIDIFLKRTIFFKLKQLIRKLF